SCGSKSWGKWSRRAIAARPTTKRTTSVTERGRPRSDGWSARRPHRSWHELRPPAGTVRNRRPSAGAWDFAALPLPDGGVCVGPRAALARQSGVQSTQGKQEHRYATRQDGGLLVRRLVGIALIVATVCLPSCRMEDESGSSIGTFYKCS